MLPRSFALLVAACAALAFSPSARAETAPPAAPPAEQQPPAPAPAAAAAKPAARREDVEPETLPAALASLKTARADRDTAESDLAAEQAEHGKTKQLLSGTLEIATKAKADLALAQTEITTLTAARDKAVSEQGKTKELLTLAEAACGVLGVDPANAVPAASEAPAGKTLSLPAFRALSPAARTAFLKTGGKLSD